MLQFFEQSMFRMRRGASTRFWNRSALCNRRFFAHNPYGNPSTSKRSYYEVLGVSDKASSAEIKAAFLTLSKKYHPDVCKDDKNGHERFVEINEAYAVLSKPETRRQYDSNLAGGRTSTDRRDDFGRQWHAQSADPVDEMYRRYFYELYRRRYPYRSQQDYKGQRQESPFRDPRRDPPIWPEGTMHDDRRAGGDGQRPFSRNPTLNWTFGGGLVRFYVTCLLVALISTIILDFSIEKERRERWAPYRQLDPNLEERWKDVVITEKSSPTKDAVPKSDGHSEY